MEILPFRPKSNSEKTFVVTPWAEKRDAERYAQNTYSKVSEIVKPYLASPIVIKHYEVETSVCPHFLEAIAT